uniref:Uncharacterized protein n=1 Tax=Timema cristinae TaxID=61476 RepID=A0A7R9CCE1_TIMCR|nr:unnamed protein product [Timema cristinae]
MENEKQSEKISQKIQPEFDAQLSRPRNSYASQINDIICPEHDLKAYSILIPHPSDCAKYYECSNGVSVLENCPPGLEFNPILFVCDWPNSAGCVHGCAPLIVENGSSWEPTSCMNGKSEFGTECSIQCASGYERSDIVTIQCTTNGWNSTDGTDAIPHCKHIQGCAPLNIIEGSSWIPTSCVNGKNDIGTECSIQCADDYERSGSNSIQCTGDGWNSTDGIDFIPSCKPTQGCAPLKLDESSSWAPTSCGNGKSDIGTECNIQCTDGYESSGSVSIQCTTEGWNSTDGVGVIPSCKHTQGCVPLNVEVCSSWAPTSCVSGNSDIGTVCSIHCEDGYERCGSINVQCTAYGWNSTDGLNVIPSCKYIQGCAPLNVEEGSLWIPTSCANGYNEIGTECSIQCVDGYERSGSVSIQCTADGWNSTSGLNVMPTCDQIQGCAPLNVEEGSLWTPTSCVNDYNEIGTECSIQCVDGFERSGSGSIQCTHDGWNSTSGLNVIPTCNHIQGCASLNVEEGSLLIPTSCANGYNEIGTECTIQCIDGYESSGSVSIQCTPDGWNSTSGLNVIPTCNHIQVCAPLNVEEGIFWTSTSCISDNSKIVIECSIQCAHGYERSGSVSNQCTFDGWKSATVLDDISSCNHTQKGSFWAPISCVNSISDIGTECSIQCNDGYEKSGSVSIKCTTDGWNSTSGLAIIPSCKLIPGYTLLYIKNGSSLAPTSCVDGYNDIGIEYNIEYAHSHEINGCAPLTIKNGSLWAPKSCVNGYNDYGTECSIECADGYERRGSVSIQCTTDGWNSTDGFTVIPSCELIPGCAPLKNKNDSLWTPKDCVNGYNDYGTECSIECADGYEKSGSISVQCTADGWNSTAGLDVIPSCKLIPGCATLKIKNGSSWAPKSCVNGYNDYGTECSIECAGGYERKGSVSIQCTTDGWNSTDGLSVIPSCELIPGCAPLTIKNGSSWAPKSCVNGYNDYGTECSIECAGGYERKGSVSCAALNINIGSSWAPTSCVNGYNDYGTECSIECAEGYERNGSVSIQCTTDGWNSTDGLSVIPSCELIPGCAPLNINIGSSWAPTSCVNGYNDYGTECSIECADGYERNGPVQCCPPLNTKNDSSWSPTSCVNGYNDYGTECSIDCPDGYERSEISSIQCTPDGWNSTAGLDVFPSCTLIPALGHRHLVSLGTMTLVQTAASFAQTALKGVVASVSIVQLMAGIALSGINFIPSCKSPACIGEDMKETVELSISNPGNILFVMDQSGSIGRSNYKMGLDFIKNVINGFPLSANRNAGVILFDSTAVVAIPVNENSTANFLKGVDGLGYNGGGTDITAALLLGSQEINDHGFNRHTLVILITDGISKTDPMTAAQNLKDAGHTLFTIGVTQAVDMSLMEQWASKGTDGSLYYLQVKTYADLKAVGEYFIHFTSFFESWNIVNPLCSVEIFCFAHSVKVLSESSFCLLLNFGAPSIPLVSPPGVGYFLMALVSSWPLLTPTGPYCPVLALGIPLTLAVSWFFLSPSELWCSLNAVCLPS